jgi:hypothetical protein
MEKVILRGLSTHLELKEWASTGIRVAKFSIN